MIKMFLAGWSKKIEIVMFSCEVIFTDEDMFD